MTRCLTGLLLLGLLAAPKVSQAQSLLEDYTIRHWNVEDGLPEASVLSIHQMPDGYLWLTTPHQVVRFDGTGFLSLPRDHWPSNFVSELRQLHLDREGNMWLCGSESLLRFDGRVWQEVLLSGGTHVSGGSLITLETPDGAVKVPAKREFFCLGNDTDGTVLAASNEGVYRFDGRQMVLVPLKTASGTNPPVITAAAISHQGVVWFAADGSLLRFQEGVYAPEAFPEDLQPKKVYRVMAADEDILWIQQLDGRLFRRCDGRWAEVKPAGLRVSSVAEIEQGTIRWIGSAEGLHQWQNGLWRSLNASAGEVPSDVRCLTLSRDGCLWIGTSWGLYRLQPRSVHMFQTSSNMVHCAVTAIWPISTNEFWAGSRYGGLLVGEAGALRPKLLNEPGLKWIDVSALLQTSDRNLWIGTHGGHLWSLSTNGVVQQTRQTDAFKSRNITCLLEDDARQLWVGTREGLLRRNSGDNTLVTVNNRNRSVAILALCNGPKGTVWVGTQDGGLWELFQGKLVREFHRRDGLRSETVRFLRYDEAGVLWIGTPAGVARWAGDQMQVFHAEQGLPDADIRQMLDDGEGHLWLGVRCGLLRVDKSEFAAVAAGRKQRVSFLQLDQDAGLSVSLTSGDFSPLSARTSDGRLWFCTEEGLAMVDATRLRNRSWAGNLEVEEIRTDDGFRESLRQLSPEKASLATDRAARRTVLPPGSTGVEILFTLPDYVAPGQVLFQTMLEGYDSAWMPPSPTRSVKYPRLSAGEYSFHLQASAGDGVWRELNQPVVFSVGAFFYQTRWFKALGGVLILSLAGVTSGWVVRRRARRRFREMEREKARELAVESERARIARDIHDDLGATLTQIAMLSESAETDTQAASALKSRFKDIFTHARNATRQLDETVWAINPRNDALEHLMVYLCEFAEDYLALAGIRFRLDEPDELPERMLNSSQRHHLFLAAREALHNVVKHAQATEVWVHIRLENEVLHLSIEDNGVGSEPIDADSAHGSANLRQRLAQLGGVAERRPGPAGGTIVELILPLTKT